MAFRKTHPSPHGIQATLADSPRGSCRYGAQTDAPAVDFAESCETYLKYGRPTTCANIQAEMVQCFLLDFGDGRFFSKYPVPKKLTKKQGQIKLGAIINEESVTK